MITVRPVLVLAWSGPVGVALGGWAAIVGVRDLPGRHRHLLHALGLSA